MIAHRFDIPYDGPPVLGLGAFLKNTVSLLRPGEALVSEDLGNLETRKAVEDFERAVTTLIREAGEAPSAVGHDLHPDFHSTRRAREMEAEAVPIQHHHAHVAAVMAEHGERGPVLGLAFDGYGLGADGQSWGGELLRVGPEGFRRLGHLRPLQLPGGDKAAREPWRMASAVLHALGRGSEIESRFSAIPGAAVVHQMLDKDTGGRTTTSAGRLFDAAAALLGVKPVATFEGEAPMALEAMVSEPSVMLDGWTIEDGRLDLMGLMGTLAGIDRARGADLFHGTLIAAIAEWVREAAETEDLWTVVFSGGCFLNRILDEGLTEALQAEGLHVLKPKALSPGDQAVSLGQAWAIAIGRS